MPANNVESFVYVKHETINTYLSS